MYGHVSIRQIHDIANRIMSRGVGDLIPEITDMLQIPLSPEINEEVLVFAEVVDDELDNVTLYYRVDNGTWSSVSMVYVSGLGFRGVIPGQSGGVAVDYYVVAYDVDGNSDLSETISYYVPEITTTTTPTTAVITPSWSILLLLLSIIVLIPLRKYERKI